MRIVIMGTGGVGGYYGGRLAKAGHDVTFVARGAHLRAMRDNGLRVKSVAGDFTIKAPQCTEHPANISGPIDVIMVATKMWDLAAAAQAMLPIVSDRTMVVPLLNGIDAVQILAGVVPKSSIVGGLTYIVSTIEAPGIISHTSAVQKIIIGELDGTVSERVRRFVSVGVAAGIDIATTVHIQEELWEKLLSICPYSGVTSLVRLPIGPILRDPMTRALYRRCMEEVKAVADTQGIRLPDGIVDKKMAFAATLESTATSSMQRDLEQGHRLELESLNGTVVRLGKSLGVPTPVNDFIYAALKLHADGHPSSH